MEEQKKSRLGLVGGQAVLEGVMMKSGNDVNLAVRGGDGKIVTSASTFTSIRKKYKICGLPIIRGCVNFVESMMLSMSTLTKSMEMLGIEYYNQLCMQFKWADSDTLLDEMADFYIDGDAAPLGRLNYVYQNYIPGVSTDIKPAKVITMAEKAAGEENYFGVVTTDTEPEEAPTTGSETEVEVDVEGGCKAVAGGMMLIALVGLCACVLGKKKD